MAATVAVAVRAAVEETAVAEGMVEAEAKAAETAAAAAGSEEAVKAGKAARGRPMRR
jgi:hypothetical protein